MAGRSLGGWTLFVAGVHAEEPAKRAGSGLLPRASAAHSGARAYPRPVPRAPLRLAPVLTAALACAGPAPLPAGVSPEPQRGDALTLLLAKLEHASDPAPRVAVRELHLSAVDTTPWRTLPAEAAAAHTGRVALIAGRRCTWRDGLERAEQDTGSWYLFEQGALVAFDHQGFGVRCTVRPTFEFLPPEESDLERHLVRFVSQRYPLLEVPADVRLARGLQLLAQGRRADAEYELLALDRRLRELGRLQSEDETPDPAERAQLAREEERLRPLRAKLAHALDDDETKGTEQP
jgi:hypothetical protein